MDNKSNYQDDLKSIKGAPANPKDMPFVVPGDYFSQLEAKILMRVRIITDTEKSFTIPDLYFTSLPDKIRQRIQFEEQEDRLADVIGNDDTFIKNLKDWVPEAGFTTPTSYFETSRKQMVEAVFEENKNDQVIPFMQRRASHTWIKYAAAACIAVCIGIYAFFQLNTPDSFEKRLNNIPESDIVSYLEYYNEFGDGAAFEAQFDGVLQLDKELYSEEEIEAYLDYSI